MTHPWQAAGPLGPESSSPAEAAAGLWSQESDDRYAGTRPRLSSPGAPSSPSPWPQAPSPLGQLRKSPPRTPRGLLSEGQPCPAPPCPGGPESLTTQCPSFLSGLQAPAGILCCCTRHCPFSPPTSCLHERRGPRADQRRAQQRAGGEKRGQRGPGACHALPAPLAAHCLLAPRAARPPGPCLAPTSRPLPAAQRPSSATRASATAAPARWPQAQPRRPGSLCPWGSLRLPARPCCSLARTPLPQP